MPKLDLPLSAVPRRLNQCCTRLVGLFSALAVAYLPRLLRVDDGPPERAMCRSLTPALCRGQMNAESRMTQRPGLASELVGAWARILESCVVGMRVMGCEGGRIIPQRSGPPPGGQWKVAGYS